MTDKRPPFVHKYLTRHGKVTYYYRGPNKRRLRLPDEYGTDEFWQAVEIARASNPPEMPIRFAKFDRKTVGRIGRVMVAAVRAARTRSRKRSWEFDLTADWALNKAKDQGFRCSLTGLPFFAESGAKSKVHPFTPSLDRIDCSRGYTKDNVRVVVWAINAMLLDWGEEVFAQVAARYRAHQGKLRGAMLAPRKQRLLPNKSSKNFNSLPRRNDCLVRSRKVT